MNIENSYFPSYILDEIKKNKKEMENAQYSNCSCDQGTCHSCLCYEKLKKNFEIDVKSKYIKKILKEELSKLIN